MLNLCLALAAALVPQDSWTALRLPELCEESNPAAQLPALPCAEHIALDDSTDSPRRTGRALLTAQDVSSLLERVAGAAGRRLSFFPYAPPLLAQGSSADLEWATGSLAALDAAGKRNRVTISAWLVPESWIDEQGAERVPTGDGDGGNQRHWSTVAGPGEEVVFGRRRHEDFVANFDVNVSTDSGVAAPTIGGVFSGETVHLSASRVAGGEKYHLRGQLDLAELVGFETFEPDTPDLGELRQPRVLSTSLIFSGVAKRGEFLRVELEGTPLSKPDWTLYVRVDTAVEPKGPAAAGTVPGLDWRSIDVTLLSKRAASLPYFDPGAGLHDQAALEALSPQAATITASGVMSAVEAGARSRRPSSGRTSSDPDAAVHIGEGFLLVVAEETTGGLAERLAEFMSSVEEPRLASSVVELKSGALRARFPLATGEAGRLTVGEERTLLTGYEAEIAPNAWMPSPIVERNFDGIAWQGRVGGDHLFTAVFSSSTESISVQDRFQAQLGAIQLPKRSVRSARKTVRIDSGRHELLSTLDDSAGVEVLLSRP